MLCTSCGKPTNTICQVLRTLSTGKYKEILVCKACASSFRPIERMVTILDGPTYSWDDCPPHGRNDARSRWRNEVPLPYPRRGKRHPLARHVPIQRFPLIEDFEVVMEGSTSVHEQEEHRLPHYSVAFLSPSRGFLVCLYRIEPCDLIRPLFKIPHGSFRTPYEDLDENWNVFIAEYQEFVYVTAGVFILAGKQTFEPQETWFKVEKRVYYHQWKKLIHRCRALKELFADEKRTVE